MDENEELCPVCSSKFKYTRPLSIKKKTETDFTKILQGRVYGGNSRKIYEKFCETLAWDKWKVDQFGWQTPLYAKNADTDRKRDIWFIFHANYDPDNLDSVVGDAHVINLITDNGDRIIEVVDERFGKTNPADRITFVKTNNGYEFFGIYTVVKNGTTRVYKRIADNYPMN
ncbi:MAG: hypothetical protein FWE62_04555 [Firmicutes bacterium]|nr:hypothetical protein [Bacillota bacterium]